MNTEALILVGKILAWIILVGNAIGVALRARRASMIAYDGSVEQKLDKLQGQISYWVFKRNLLWLTASFVYIVVFWGVK